MTEPTRNAYDLLSRPTLDLTDEEVEAVVANLRERRERFLQGIPDKPRADKKKTDAGQLTAAQKQENSKALLAQLNLGQLKLPGLAKKD